MAERQIGHRKSSFFSFSRAFLSSNDVPVLLLKQPIFPPNVLVWFISNTYDFSSAPLENVNWKVVVLLNCIFSITTSFQQKAYLKKLWRSLKMDIKTASGFYHVLRILRPSSHFYWTRSPTHSSGQFLVSLVVFLGDEELIFLLLYIAMIS